MSYPILKYPRTPHLEGSRLQAGDEDLSQVPFSHLKGKYLVIEEKVDGANTGISFDNDGTLLLQSRGHYLTGGYRERHYNLFKQWANVHKEALYKVLGTRYILYGEWLYAKHTVYYDNLPHYFLEYDVYDRETNKFLSTVKRGQLLKGLPIKSVPVLKCGYFNKIEDIISLLADSHYITKNKKNVLKEVAIKNNLDVEKVLKETDDSLLMEGLYIKVESEDEVLERLKYVRYSFFQSIIDSETHWLDRPIIPNQIDKEIWELF